MPMTPTTLVKEENLEEEDVEVATTKISTKENRLVKGDIAKCIFFESVDKAYNSRLENTKDIV